MVKVKCFRNTFFGYVRNCQTSSFLNKLIRGEYKRFKTSKMAISLLEAFKKKIF